MRDKKRWSDLTPRQRKFIVVGVILEAAMTTAVLVDLARRPAAQVRGRKPVWVLSFVVQPFGPLAYLAFGRRGSIQ